MKTAFPVLSDSLATFKNWKVKLADLASRVTALEGVETVIPSTTEFFIEVAKGNVAGHSLVNKFGRNPDVDTGSAPEDIWDGSNVHVPPTAARTHDIVSSSASDTSAGTGARAIWLQGLDGDWNLQEETITMNGITNVPTVNTYRRIFRMRVTETGTTSSNVGDITATAQTDATITAQITTAYGQTLMAIYTIPANKTGYVLNYYGSIKRGSPSGSSADLEIVVKDTQSTGQPTTIKHANGLQINGGNPFNHIFRVPIIISEKQDIVLRASSVGANNTVLDGGFEILLVDN